MQLAKKMKYMRIIGILSATSLLTGCFLPSYEPLEEGEKASDEIVIDISPDIFIPAVENETEIEEEEAAKPEQEVDLSYTLLFGGDVFLSSHVLAAYEKAGGITGVVDENYRNLINQADFFMVNEEFPFSNRGEQAQDKEYTFRLPPEKVSVFQEMGIDGVSLANNHALDFGEEALLDSCAALDQAGILRTGAGANIEEARKPILIDRGNFSGAIIGATRVMPDYSWTAGKSHAGMLSSYDPDILLKEIAEQKTQGRMVIVYVHWGVEKDEKPQDYQRTLGQQYIDAGADVVIGSHPHVLQGIEYYKGKPIFYSLGNFVFGSSIPRVALLEMKVEEAEDDSKITLRLIPGTSGAGYTRTLGEETEKEQFYQYMESLSPGIKIQPDGTVMPPGLSSTN